MPEARGEPQQTGGQIKAVAGQGGEQGPGGHRAGIVAAALELVPRVTPVPIVPGAGALNDGQTALELALVDEVRRDLVLDPAPHLV